MASSVNVNHPIVGSPTTSSVRDNMAVIKAEIEALQDGTAIATATTTTEGVAELATQTEVNDGTGAAHIITPVTLAASTQLSNKLPKTSAVEVNTAQADTLATGNLGADIVYTSATANIVTVPGTLAVGFQCTLTRAGAGSLTITSSDNLNGASDDLAIAAQWSTVWLMQYSEGNWVVIGDTV